jgi:hypothetical protein
MDFTPDFSNPSVAPLHWIAAASLVLAACSTVPPLEYPPDHPANPAAPAAAEMRPLSTLATYQSFAGAARPDADASPNAGAGEASKTEKPSQGGAHEHHQ